MISYASCFEDVILWRALASRVHHDVGFWIDVGAFDPVDASVTKVFYDHNWHGINIEPMQAQYDRLVDQRPRDINIQALVGDVEGLETFFQVSNGQLSTVNEEFAQRHAVAGNEVTRFDLAATTLKKICEKYAPPDIHFLKIDVEGNEAKAIRGMDFNRFRPWILVIEATEPNDMNALTHNEWEYMISEANYQHVFTWLPNRYYVANERPELKSCFINRVDDYQRYADLRRIQELEREVIALNAELSKRQ